MDGCGQAWASSTNARQPATQWLDGDPGLRRRPHTPRATDLLVGGDQPVPPAAQTGDRVQIVELGLLGYSPTGFVLAPDGTVVTARYIQDHA